MEVPGFGSEDPAGVNGASRGLGTVGQDGGAGEGVGGYPGEKGSVAGFGGRQDVHSDRQDERKSLEAGTFQS